MSLKTKTTAALRECVFDKNANRFSLLKITSITLLMIFCGVTSIKAQIEGDLYGQQTGDLAGVSSLMLAVSNNDLEGVKFFSRAGGFLINQKNIGGATALHIAARNGNIDIIIALLENGADVNIADNEGWTPLMRAAGSGNAKIVEALLAKGANVGALNSSHETALIHATLADCSDCLNYIFTKSDLIKSMDNKLLKEQLIDAFIIARNRENKIAQNLLEGYLDRVTKMAPLANNAASDVAIGNKAEVISGSQQISQIPQQFISQSGKVKYILVDEENKTSTPLTATTTPAPVAAVIAPNIAPASPIDIAPTIMPKAPEQETITTIITTSPVRPSSQNPSISNIVQSVLQQDANVSPVKVNTRFKFVAGAPGVIVAPAPETEIAPSSNKIEQVQYKFHSGSEKLYAPKPKPKQKVLSPVEKSQVIQNSPFATNPSSSTEDGGITLELRPETKP